MEQKIKNKENEYLVSYLNVFHLLIVISFLFFLNTGCGKKPPVTQKNESAPSLVISPALDLKKSTTPVIPYVYKGYRLRDPFISLSGGKVAKGKEDKLTAANVRSFMVKGIIDEEGDRTALLALPGGRNYVLREGVLIDTEGRVISGIEGVIEKNRIDFYLGDTDNPIEVKLDLLTDSPRVELYKKGKKKEMEQHFSKASALYKQGKYKEAIAEWGKVLVIDATHRLSQQKIEKARKKLELAAKPSPTTKVVEKDKKRKMEKHFAKASALYKQGKYKEAIAEWEKVLEIDPNHTSSKEKIEKARTKLPGMK